MKRFDFAGGRVETKSLAIASPDVGPGLSGRLHIPIPEDVSALDAMSISVSGPDGKELYTWTKTICKAEEYAVRLLQDRPVECEAVLCDGQLTGLRTGEAVLPLTDCRYAMEYAGGSGGISITNHPDGWVEVTYLFNGDAKWRIRRFSYLAPNEGTSLMAFATEDSFFIIMPVKRFRLLKNNISIIILCRSNQTGIFRENIEQHW